MEFNKGKLPIIQGVRRESRLGIIPEIGNKSLSILEFDFQCLIIDWRPLSFDSLTLAAGSVLAELSLSHVTVFNIDLNDIFLSKLKLEVLINDLHPIGQLVSAYVLYLKQIHKLGIPADMEGPLAREVLLQAVYWLIGLD